jgi:polyisoprenoid-binding protein YceI
MRTPLALATLALFATQALAQMPMPKEAPGKVDIKRVAAGTYSVDTGHTLVAWEINHFGFNNYFGLFGGATGSLTLDPAHPAKDSVSIEIPMSGLTTTNTKLNEHLSGKEFFDVASFTTAKFVSSKVMVTGTHAMIHGNLTLHGVTKPIVLNATFTGAGMNTFMKKETVGFMATASLKRSDYGLAGFIPLVGDEVNLRITAAFEK